MAAAALIQDPSVLARYAMGTPVLLGTITATTTKNNHDTAVPFLNTGDGLAGKVLLVQSDAACHILPGTANTSVVTTATGIKLFADDAKIFVMGSTFGWLAVIGTANLKVWELKLP